MKLIVYYDEDYATSWIPREVSVRIRDFFKDKGFLIFGAEDLAKWMEASVDTSDACCDSLIVFSQDAFPETVIHGDVLNSLVRSYLDSGGTIVWIGDMPFYYEACHPSRQRELGNRFSRETIERMWKESKIGYPPEASMDSNGRFMKVLGKKGCFRALGLMTIYLDYPNSKAEITEDGRGFGLRLPWFGCRPILIKGSTLPKRIQTLFKLKSKPIALAKSKPRYLISQEKLVLSEKKERRLSLNFLDLFFKIIGVVPALITIITSLAALYIFVPSFGIAAIWPIAGIATIILVLNVLYWFLWSRSTYASAWFMNFDKRHPYSGFIRLWDFGPWRITNAMLEELQEIVVKINELKK